MVGSVLEEAPVMGSAQVIKEYLAEEKSRRTVKKNVNIMGLGDFQESNYIWHSKSWVQDAPEATTKVFRLILD